MTTFNDCQAAANYDDFIRAKLSRVPPTGLSSIPELPAGLFDFQAAIVRWSLQRGRAAIFADTGLGKSRMQLAWADTVNKETGHDVLILAPLAVAGQTVPSLAPMLEQAMPAVMGSTVKGPAL